METKKISLKHDRFNSILVETARGLNGKWDAETREWLFDEMLAEEVNELANVFNSQKVVVKLTAKTLIEKKDITFCGYTISRCFNNYSAALGDGVALIFGKYKAGGSNKYPRVSVEAGSVFKLKIPQAVLEKYVETDDFSFEIQ